MSYDKKTIIANGISQLDSKQLNSLFNMVAAVVANETHYSCPHCHSRHDVETVCSCVKSENKKTGLINEKLHTALSELLAGKEISDPDYQAWKLKQAI